MSVLSFESFTSRIVVTFIGDAPAEFRFNV